MSYPHTSADCGGFHDLDRDFEGERPTEPSPVQPNCEHHYASLLGGVRPHVRHVRICMLCGAVDFADLAEQSAAIRAEVAAENAAEIEQLRAAVERAREVYRKFFTDAQVGRDSYRQFVGKLQAELFEALHGKPWSSSIWLDQISREQHEAENPHHSCGKEQTHEGHVWRGSRREFGGACEVMRTYWCEGVVSDQEAL